MNELSVSSVCVVGHSWGASVALNIAAQGSLHPLRVESCVLIDGGAFAPANIIDGGSVTRSELTAALTPPLGPFTDDELMDHYLPAHSSALTGQEHSIMSAIMRSYVPAPQGGWVTTIGFDRHMAVIEAFLDYSPDADLESLTVPTWILMARDSFTPGEHGSTDAWARARSQVDTKVWGKTNIALQHWYGAVHDVPLYWPHQVSQLISHAASTCRFAPNSISDISGKRVLA
jgi:pimeloyl-ACP methyl ester carboxylesterase